MNAKALLILYIVFALLACNKEKSEGSSAGFEIKEIPTLVVEKNGETTESFKVDYLLGPKDKVIASLSQLPDGVSAQFDTTSGIPPFSFNIRLAAMLIPAFSH